MGYIVNDFFFSIIYWVSLYYDDKRDKINKNNRMEPINHFCQNRPIDFILYALTICILSLEKLSIFLTTHIEGTDKLFVILLA